MKCLTFCFNKQIIAVDILNVQEITGVLAMTTTCFKHPEFIASWITLRCRQLLVLDLRRHKIENSPETCIIVIQDDIHDLTFGLLVDSVHEIMNIPDKLNRETIISDDLNSVVQNTDVIKFMVNMNKEDIWIMGPRLLTNWQARKLYELYQ